MVNMKRRQHYMEPRTWTDPRIRPLMPESDKPCVKRAKPTHDADVGPGSFITDTSSPMVMNHQLIGDTISIMLWHASHPNNPVVLRTFSLNLCNSFWTVKELLRKLQQTNQIAKKVILSVGYIECKAPSFEPVECITFIKSIIFELKKKGCKKIILTNVPPCAAASLRLTYWNNLQYLNEALKRICDENEDLLYICNVFQLFAEPIKFLRRKEYVVNGKPNYAIFQNMYNHISNVYPYTKKDFITFSCRGKSSLLQHVKKTIRYRSTSKCKSKQSFSIIDTRTAGTPVRQSSSPDVSLDDCPDENTSSISTNNVEADFVDLDEQPRNSCPTESSSSISTCQTEDVFDIRTLSEIIRNEKRIVERTSDILYTVREELNDEAILNEGRDLLESVDTSQNNENTASDDQQGVCDPPIFVISSEENSPIFLENVEDVTEFDIEVVHEEASSLPPAPVKQRDNELDSFPIDEMNDYEFEAIHPTSISRQQCDPDSFNVEGEEVDDVVIVEQSTMLVQELKTSELEPGEIVEEEAMLITKETDCANSGKTTTTAAAADKKGICLKALIDCTIRSITVDVINNRRKPVRRVAFTNCPLIRNSDEKVARKDRTEKNEKKVPIRSILKKSRSEQKLLAENGKEVHSKIKKSRTKSREEIPNPKKNLEKYTSRKMKKKHSENKEEVKISQIKKAHDFFCMCNNCSIQRDRNLGKLEKLTIQLSAELERKVSTINSR